MKKTTKKIEELSDRELQERQTTHLAQINKNLKSINGNVAFIFWVLFLSIILTIIYIMIS